MNILKIQHPCKRGMVVSNNLGKNFHMYKSTFVDRNVNGNFSLQLHKKEKSQVLGR